ncbi:MAG: four helix bundle protein [Bacteroidales bacterium]|nr:four helix bundle protein [Bacteroidales bacterium]
MTSKYYIPLKDLEVYQLAREISRLAWKIYELMNWQDRKIIGDQFIRSADSIGANVAEGYGRFHFLDRIKFYYNSRASFFEFRFHWLELLLERNKISNELFNQIITISEKFSLKLQNFISSTYKAREKK